MARTESMMLELGTPAPAFNLPDVVSGNAITLDTFKGKKGLLVMFICRHCPYVKLLEQGLAELGRDYASQPLGIVAISCNDAEKYPDDAPASLQEMATTLGFNFPFCFDENQAVAKAYTAACTPDFFLFDQDFKLFYRGQFDDSRPGNEKPVTGKDLRAAIDQLLANQPAPAAQRPSIGCNIKWIPGNEPDYYGLTAVPKS
jgi:peroxiredoxin